MNDNKWIAWIYWDPPREAFTIPFLDHPIFWYGILFVMGFILGYFILIPILTRFLTQSRHLSSLHIVNWPLLIKELKTSSSPLISELMTHFDLNTRQQLKQNLTPPLTPVLQQNILNGFNSFLKCSSTSLDTLQNTFSDSLAPPRQIAYFLADRLCWFVVIGTLIGARLGAVFFYDWPYFRENPTEIIKIWHGGLASHGGILGVILSLYFYLKYVQKWVPQLTFLTLLDDVAIPATLVCCFIRLGNFMNQEIIGTPTTLPWGVLFGHPVDNSIPIPRHPVQLYEAAVYLGIFFILWNLWRSKRLDNFPGALIGLSFIFGFSGRFILEFWKATQDSILDSSMLQMGQLLSLPFILIGIYLVYHSKSLTCCPHHPFKNNVNNG